MITTTLTESAQLLRYANQATTDKGHDDLFVVSCGPWLLVLGRIYDLKAVACTTGKLFPFVYSLLGLEEAAQASGIVVLIGKSFHGTRCGIRPTRRRDSRDDGTRLGYMPISSHVAVRKSKVLLDMVLTTLLCHDRRSPLCLALALRKGQNETTPSISPRWPGYLIHLAEEGVGACGLELLVGPFIAEVQTLRVGANERASPMCISRLVVP